MQVDAQIKIRSNPYLYQYLRENSYWYKYLNRNPLAISRMEQEMKEKYKLTPKDKLENVSNTLSLLEAFMNVLK